MPLKTKPSSADWEKQKEAIRRLYLGQDLTLQKVRTQLEDDGFVATKAQYEAKFKEWGFSKNVPVNIWKHVGFTIGKRKREGKDSAVSINGIEIPIKRVKKEISRHYYSVIERAEFEKLNAPSPPGSLAVVSTPPTQQEVLIVERWPSNLPWFSFIRFLDARLEGLPRMQLNPQTFQGGLPFTQKKSHANDNLVEQSRTEISGGRQLVFDTIKEYAPSDLNHALLPFSSDVEWPADINSSMSLESTTSNHWGLKTLIYLASNKLLESSDIDAIWKMIDNTGINKLANFSNSSVWKNTSLEAAMEYLFETGIKQEHVRLVRWLLDSGMEPNTKLKLESAGTEAHLPLIVALSSNRWDSYQMVRLLLSKGSSPVLICCKEHGSPTQFQIWNDFYTDPETLRIFWFTFSKIMETLDHHPDSQSLRHENGFSVDLSGLIQLPDDEDLNMSHKPDDKAPDIKQLIELVEAIATRTSEPGALLITPRGLIHAVENRDEELIRFFHKHGLPMDCCDENNRFPLLAAVEPTDYENSRTEMDMSIVITLFELGASPNYNPAPHASNSCSFALQTAIHHSRYVIEMADLVESLVEHGSTVQGSTTCGVVGHNTLMDCALSLEHPEDLLPIAATLHDAGLPLPKAAFLTALELEHRERSNYSAKDSWVPIMPEDPSDLFLRSERGWTALDYVVAISSVELYWLEKLLLEHGVKHTRSFLHFHCIQWRWTIEEVERLISRVSAPRNTEQRRDLLFFHLIGLLRATDLGTRDSERVFDLLNQYCTVPRSLKHESKLIDVACSSGEAEIIATTLDLLPGTYGYGALGALVMCEALDDWNRHTFILELLRRRRDSSVEWTTKTYRLAQIVQMALKVKEDKRILEWLYEHDREALECAALRPSTFAVNVFDRNLKKQLGDPNVTQWLGYGLKASSYLGLLVALSGQVKMMSALLRQGFQPNRRINWSLKALQIAVARADEPMALRLLEAGCDVNARPPWRDIPKLVFDKIPDRVRRIITFHRRHTRRSTALQLAVERGDLSMINLLLNFGADVDGPAARVGGATALQLACIKGYIEIVRLLISKGANVYAPEAEYFGRTALEGAAEHGRLDIVYLLLERECRLSGSFRRQYIRAVGFSRAQGHHVLSRFLQDFGSWTMEDENLLAQTDLCDKEPDSRDLEEYLREQDNISDIDLGGLEPESDDSIWCETEDEFQLEDDENSTENDQSDTEDYESISEDGDLTPDMTQSASQEVKNSSGRPEQVIRPLSTQRLDWEELIDYFGDDEEEIL